MKNFVKLICMGMRWSLSRSHAHKQTTISLSSSWRIPLASLAHLMTLICSQVHVFRLGLLHSVPATAHGCPLQAPLQHVRFAVRVHRGVRGAAVWRRAAARAASRHPLPRLGRRAPTLPVPHHVHACFAHHAGRRLRRHQVSFCTLCIIELL